MTRREIEKYKARLEKLCKRVDETAESVIEQARQSTGGESAGDLSNTPIHLGGIGSETYSQELGATLLENEQFLETEIFAALDRIEKKSFGRCEKCQEAISRERLDAVPYARHCIACAKETHAGHETNLNEGRPQSWEKGIGLRAEGPPPGKPGGPVEARMASDRHAAGSPGGGSAIGGLAGTNIGIGDPEESDLEDAMAGGVFDAEIETEQIEEQRMTEQTTEGYAGHAGGAVGGTPANKRATGGRTHLPKKSR